MAGLILESFKVHPIGMATKDPARELLIATELEAKPILADGEMGWSWDKALGCYSSSRYNMRLWITGIGPTRSSYEMGRLMALSSGSFLNLGVAGALTDLEVGGILQIEQVCADYERHPFHRKDDELLLSPVNSELNLVRCVSVGEAVHDEVNKSRLEKNADLVDMELYALAACSQWAKRNLSSVKVVSDFASEVDAKEIVKRIPQLMAELWCTVKSEIVVK